MRLLPVLLLVTACAPATTVAPVSARVSNGPAAAELAARVLTGEGFEIDSATDTSGMSTWREMTDDVTPWARRSDGQGQGCVASPAGHAPISDINYCESRGGSSGMRVMGRSILSRPTLPPST